MILNKELNIALHECKVPYSNIANYLTFLGLGTWSFSPLSNISLLISDIDYPINFLISDLNSLFKNNIEYKNLECKITNFTKEDIVNSGIIVYFIDYFDCDLDQQCNNDDTENLEKESILKKIAQCKLAIKEHNRTINICKRQLLVNENKQLKLIQPKFKNKSFKIISI